MLPGAPASQFHPTAVERRGRRSGGLIRQALYLDQEDAYAAGEAAGEAVPPALLGVGFLARALVQATLPHSDPKTYEFVRRNGHLTLSILAPKDVGLPFGRYPRLVLAYLTREAVRRKSPDIELGSHFSHFCAALGIPPTTGPRGSMPMLREQLQRLFASTFQCIFHDESQGRHAGDGFLIAEKRELWWDPRPGKGEAAWGSHVLLSDRFFREATEAPVPLDLRVRRGSRGFDLVPGGCLHETEVWLDLCTPGSPPPKQRDAPRVRLPLEDFIDRAVYRFAVLTYCRFSRLSYSRKRTRNPGGICAPSAR